MFGPYDRENPSKDASYSFIQDNLAYWESAFAEDNFEAMSKYLNKNTEDKDCILFEHLF